MFISDKSGKEGAFVIRPNHILFSCKLNKTDLASSKIIAITDKKKKLLSLTIDNKISNDVATAYNLVYAIHGKNIGLPGDYYQSTEMLKKRIIANAFFAIAAKQFTYKYAITRKCSADRTFSIEEYVLAELINKYKPEIAIDYTSIEPIEHSKTFIEMLEWAASSDIEMNINDIFSFYYKDLFSNAKSVVEEAEETAQFYKAKSFKTETGNSFLYSDKKNFIPVYKLLPVFCQIFNSDWQAFFQALQKLSNYGLVSVKHMVVQKHKAIKLMPSNIINPFLEFAEAFDYHTIVKLLANITRAKFIKCSICGDQLMFSSKIQLCSGCGTKTITSLNGEKISNWKCAIAEYSSQIYFFSEKKQKYMVLYKKKIGSQTFAFFTKPN